jgi:hypothetical protein
MPERLTARMERKAWPLTPLFGWLQRAGNVSDDEMLRVFNCGIGMVVIVGQEHSQAAITTLQASGKPCGGSALFMREKQRAASYRHMKTIVILISGRGSNMQTILEARLPAKIAAVISNQPHAGGLELPPLMESLHA